MSGEQVNEFETKQFIVFSLGDEQYGIDSLKITTIDRMKKITRVPKTPRYVRGVINLRGDIIPVMDLRAKFNLPIAEETDETRIIILKLEEISVGVVVDQVLQTIQLTNDSIESASSLINNSDSDYILGIGKVDGEIVTLLNFDKLVKLWLTGDDEVYVMTISFNELNNLQLDVLKEIGNIGAGNAVTSLAKMLDKRVDMAVPKARILGFDKVSQILGGEEVLVVGILLHVSGDITGSMMFTMDINAARQLVNILFGNKDSVSIEFDELELSALKEIGNILTASYLSALAGLTNLKILPSVPELAIDMAGAILSVPAIEFGKVGDSVLYIETEFSEGITKVFGDFLLIPDVDSYEVLLKALGVIE